MAQKLKKTSPKGGLKLNDYFEALMTEENNSKEKRGRIKTLNKDLVTKKLSESRRSNNT